MLKMFKEIHNINDVLPAVQDKKEIRFQMQPNGVTIGCYMFQDSKTFDSIEALECRGIAFDQTSKIVSRPLHKFFNLGEKEHLTPEKLLESKDIAAIFEKVDGSMLVTAWVDNQLVWRSKKSFSSDVVKLTNEYLEDPANQNIKEFATVVASHGMTAIFELTHPEARIVVAQDKPRMRLLHVRKNYTGEYVMLDPNNTIHQCIKQYDIQTVNRFNISIADALASLETMQDQEGYVVQFTNGDMVKIKCPWYCRLHRCITFLRERDIAMLVINEELDDVKNSLVEAGIDLTPVLEIETRLKNILTGIMDDIDAAYIPDKDMTRKDFAIKHKNHPLFGLIMQRFIGKDVSILEWYGRARLKEDFTLRVIANDTIAEAING